MFLWWVLIVCIEIFKVWVIFLLDLFDVSFSKMVCLWLVNVLVLLVVVGLRIFWVLVYKYCLLDIIILIVWWILLVGIFLRIYLCVLWFSVEEIYLGWLCIDRIRMCVFG